VQEHVTLGANFDLAYAWRALQPYEAWNIQAEAYADFPIEINDRFTVTPGVGILYNGSNGLACITESNTGQTFCSDRGYDTPAGRLKLNLETPIGDDGSTIYGGANLDLFGTDGAGQNGDEHIFSIAGNLVFGFKFKGVGF
jgi:hypothetical protein